MTNIFMKFEKKLREEKEMETKEQLEENVKKESLKKEKQKKKNIVRSCDGFSERDTFLRISNYFRKRAVSTKLMERKDVEDMDIKRSHAFNKCKSNETKLANEKSINKAGDEFFERYVAENPCPCNETLPNKLSFNEPLSKITNKTLPAETSSREKSISAEWKVKLSANSLHLEKPPSAKSVPTVKISTQVSLVKPLTNTCSMKSSTKSSMEILLSERTFSLSTGKSLSLSSEKTFSPKSLLPPSATPITEPFGSIDQILDLWLMPISSFTQILQRLQHDKKMNLRSEVAAKISCKKSDPLLVVEDIFRRTQNLDEMFDLSVEFDYLGTSKPMVKEYIKSGPIHL